MSDQRVVADGALYTSLIVARICRGELDRALATCSTALDASVHPAEAVLDALLVSLVDAGRAHDALELIRRLRHGGWRLREGDGAVGALSRAVAASKHASLTPMCPICHTAFSHLFTAIFFFNEQAPLGVLWVLDELCAHGIASLAPASSATRRLPRSPPQWPPTAVVAATAAATSAAIPLLHDALLLECVRAGNLGGARALCAEVRFRQLRLQSKSVEALISAELAVGRLDEANRIFERATEEYPEWRLGERGLGVGGNGCCDRGGAGGDSWGGARLGRTSGGNGWWAAGAQLLDLRGLPDAVAKLGTIRFFRNLAREFAENSIRPPAALAAPPSAAVVATSPFCVNPVAAAATAATTVERNGAPHPADLELVLVADASTGAEGASRAERLRNLLAEMQPPLIIQKAPVATATAGNRNIKLVVPAAELNRWASQVTKMGRVRRRSAHFGLVVLGHNLLWGAALIASGAAGGGPLS